VRWDDGIYYLRAPIIEPKEEKECIFMVEYGGHWLQKINSYHDQNDCPNCIIYFITHTPCINNYNIEYLLEVISGAIKCNLICIAVK